MTVGDTRDTNSAELARSLSALGIRVARITALPDDLDAVTEAFQTGLARADLVISTGGLGPTPDDLTREAIAAACTEPLTIDPELEAWLRDLWSGRGAPFPELNLKQAWLIPSAGPLPNPNGSAPGWFVTRPDGRIVVALPGPPREMRPMWADHALPRLRALGFGADVAARTYRLTGIGESQLAEKLGETLLRATNPVVATYARVEAVDIRISATPQPQRTAEELVDETAATVLDVVGDYVWATGETTWSQAIGVRLGELGWSLAAVEIGTAGSFGALMGDTDWFTFDESIALEAPAAHAPAAVEPVSASQPATSAAPDAESPEDEPADDLLAFARRARELGGSQVGVAIRARPRTGDMAASIAIVTPVTEHKTSRIAFQTGPLGRSRSALAAAAFVLEVLRSAPSPD